MSNTASLLDKLRDRCLQIFPGCQRWKFNTLQSWLMQRHSQVSIKAHFQVMYGIRKYSQVIKNCDLKDIQPLQCVLCTGQHDFTFTNANIIYLLFCSPLWTPSCNSTYTVRNQNVSSCVSLLCSLFFRPHWTPLCRSLLMRYHQVYVLRCTGLAKLALSSWQTQIKSKWMYV